MDLEEKCMADELKTGDVVVLKSGGPRMTVQTVDQYLGEPSVICMWFDKTKRMTERFQPDLLAKAASGPMGPIVV